MRTKQETIPDVMSAVVLIALRAEMEALAALLPGQRQVDRNLSGRTGDAEVEAQFDNVPV